MLKQELCKANGDGSVSNNTHSNNEEEMNLTWEEKADNVLLDFFLKCNEGKDEKTIKNLEALLREEILKSKKRKIDQSNRSQEEKAPDQGHGKMDAR